MADSGSTPDTPQSNLEEQNNREEDQPGSPKHVFDDEHEQQDTERQVENDEALNEGDTDMREPAETDIRKDSSDIEDDSDTNAIRADFGKPPSEETPDDADTLFSHLYKFPSSSSSLATTWLEAIQTNGPLAVASILSVVISISRPIETPPPDSVTAEQVMRNSPQQTIHDIDDEAPDRAHGKIIISAKDPFCRRIRRAYEDFWRRVSAEAPKVVLYDTDCFETLVVWLEAMAAAPSRSLRYAACLAAYRLVDGFVQMGNKVRKSLASMQRQLATEKRRCGVDDRSVRKGGKKLSDKGKELVKNVDELTANNSELVDLADKIFVRIFVLKYRDVSATIRQASVSALGGWILDYPDYFLDDSNNKYIGWLLSDKDPSVRKASLDCLQRMLKKKDFYSHLDLFLSRFSERIVEMTNDKDDGVCVAAISLLTNLVQHDLIERDACEHLCDLAVSEPVMEIRRASGEFLSRLLVLTVKESKKGRPKSYSTRSRRKSLDTVLNGGLLEIPPVWESKELLKELLFAATRKDVDEANADFAIDAIWDTFPAVRCWEAFAELLLTDLDPHTRDSHEKSIGKTTNSSPSEPDDLDENDKMVLSKMLLASARESSGQGDAARARVVERGERLSSQTPSYLLGKQFLPLLPRLLKQYQASPQTLKPLVQLPIYMPLASYMQDGDSGNMSALVGQILDALGRNTSLLDVAEACANALRALRDNENPAHQEVLSLLQNNCMLVVKDLALHLQGELLEPDVYAISSAVLRIRILSELVDPGLSLLEHIAKVFEFQESKGDKSPLGNEVTKNCSRIGSAIIMWSLVKLKSKIQATEGSNVAPGNALDPEESKELQRCGSQVVSLLVNIVSSSTLPLTLRITCLKCLLTPLSIVRGVEKYFTSLVKGDEAEDPKQDAHEQDFLGINGQRKTIVSCIRTCLFAVLENELGIKDQTDLSRASRAQDIPALPPTEVFDCFVSLVAFSASENCASDISRFPLFGLLLKPDNIDQEVSQGHNKVRQLCLQYGQQQQIRRSAFLRDKVRVLHEISELDASEQKQSDFCKELVETFVKLHEHADLRQSAAEELINGLLNSVVEGDGEDWWRSLAIVCHSSFGAVSFLSRENAVRLQGVAKTIVDKVENSSEEHPHAELFDTLYRTIESIADGVAPETLKSVARSKARPSSRRMKKRRRKSADSRAYAAGAIVQRASLRKSTREKKKVNYAQLDEGSFGDPMEDVEEDSEEGSDHDEDASRIEPSSTAEMARNLMRFKNSPMAKSRRPSRTEPSTGGTPRTTRRGRKRKFSSKPIPEPEEEPEQAPESPLQNEDKMGETQRAVTGAEENSPSSTPSRDLRRSKRRRRSSRKFNEYEGTLKHRGLREAVEPVMSKSPPDNGSGSEKEDSEPSRHERPPKVVDCSDEEQDNDAEEEVESGPRTRSGVVRKVAENKQNGNASSGGSKSTTEKRKKKGTVDLKSKIRRRKRRQW